MRSGNLLLVVVMLTLQLTSATFMHPNSGFAKMEAKSDTILVPFKPWKEVVVPEIMPTLVDLPNINPDKDADSLMKAIQIPQSDYYPLRIAHLVTMRSEKQRKEMFEAFHKTYGFDFPGTYSHATYANQTDVNFEQLLQAILTPRAEYLAREVYWALDGLFFTDEDTLTDIFCCIDPDVDGVTISDISSEYSKLFGRDMLADILGDVSGAYGTLLEHIISEGREKEMIDENAEHAEHAANVYYINGRGGFCDGEYAYWKFFANHAYREIRMASQYFYNKSNTEFYKYLINVTEDGCSRGWYDLSTNFQSQESFADLVLSIGDFSVNKGWYFVLVLHDALRAGDLRRISRLIRLRADKDLELAKTEYTKSVSQVVDAQQSLEQYVVFFLGSLHADKASNRYVEFVAKIIKGNLNQRRDIGWTHLWGSY